MLPVLTVCNYSQTTIFKIVKKFTNYDCIDCEEIHIVYVMRTFNNSQSFYAQLFTIFLCSIIHNLITFNNSHTFMCNNSHTFMCNNSQSFYVKKFTIFLREEIHKLLCSIIHNLYAQYFTIFMFSNSQTTM